MADLHALILRAHMQTQGRVGGEFSCVSHIPRPLSVFAGRLDATQSEQERAELNPRSLLANMAVLWFLLKIIASILVLQTEIEIPNLQRLSHNSVESKEEGFSLIPPSKRKKKPDRQREHSVSFDQEVHAN